MPRLPSPLVWLAITASLLLPLQAQEQAAASPTPPPPAPSPANIWRCITSGGIYAIDVRQIVFVSVHEYNVDKGARVTEVNISTVGQTLARFYHLQPLEPVAPNGIGQSAIEKAKELLTEAGDRSGQSDLWKKVTKSYPTTTHSHTVEYRLEDKTALQRIYDSAYRALTQRRGETVQAGEYSW